MTARKKKVVVEAEIAPAKTTKKQAAESARLDETVPGGRYIGTDGKAHDAHGNPIK